MSIVRPGGEGLLAEELFRLLDAAGRKGAPLSEIARRLTDPPPKARLQEVLTELAEEGRVAEWGRRWMSLEHTPWRAGRLQGASGGDAVLWAVAGEGRPAPAFYIRQRDLKKARDGDRVLVEPRKRRKRRPAHHLPEGVVVRILDRSDRLVGRVAGGRGGPKLLPFDRRVRLEVELPRESLADEGRYVVAELEEGSGDPSAPVRGRVVEVLGRLSEPGVDVLVALRHFRIPEPFSRAAATEAEKMPRDPAEDRFGGRRDLRSLLTVTIDGESARDFDDAISLEALGGGRFRLGVHIADVSHYVREGTPLDQDAYHRGTSVYFPERAVPMLPERLSNGLCSLRPDVPRLTLSAFLELSSRGEVLSRRFAETVIQSRRRLTYAEVRRVLEEPEAGDRERYGGDLLELLGDARRLMKKLLAARERRGSIDFDLPSGDVILDTDGYTVGIKPGQRNVAHRIVEEFMIAANEAVASELFENQVSSLYRVHEEPEEVKLAALAELLEPLGIELDMEEGVPPAAALRRVLAQVEGHSEESFVTSLVLQAMQRARYLPSSLGHYALASPHYTHFTSPIRRYPDLLVHRRLRNHLRGNAVEVDVETLLSERLPAIARRTSETERRAERAERLVLEWKALRLLGGREGETFAGRVTAVKEYGLFVRLVDEYVDGLVPVVSLSDDYYEYSEDEHQLTGRAGGRVFRLADEVRVVLTGVDIHRRMVDLAIEGLEPREEERDGGPAEGGSGRRRGGGRSRSGGRYRGRRRRRR